MDGPNLVLDFAQVCRDARSGKLSTEQLLDLLDQAQQTIRRLEADKRRLAQRLAQYEPQAVPEATTANSNPPTPNGAYSVDAENKRRKRRRRRKKSPGRKPTELKFAEAETFEDIYPEGVRRADCQLVRERAVWRLIDNKAVRVGYRIYAGPDGKEPRIPGVTPRCEYGIEILVVLAFLVYLIGISLDKACEVFGFFCELPLSKSQADALLRQVANHWEDEYDTLCLLIAQAAIVYMDETGWKVGNEKCSLWAFASQLHRVFLFGCHKDDATLDAMLPPDVFDGIGVSDDAGVYRNRFKRAQKCWAHLLCKAIKLAMMYPNETKYQQFLDSLLEISTPEMSPQERDFTNLVNELGRLMMAEELFMFVLEPTVDATNNLSERNLRSPAQDRKAGRTNKTARGARRRSVIVSVLQSLRTNLKTFNLTTVRRKPADGCKKE